MLRASGFARVLEAFYTTKPGDLGLGLLIFQSNIEAQNGRLWASSNVSRGAIFGFVAPTHAAAASCGECQLRIRRIADNASSNHSDQLDAIGTLREM